MKSIMKLSIMEKLLLVFFAILPIASNGMKGIRFAPIGIIAFITLIVDLNKYTFFKKTEDSNIENIRIKNLESIVIKKIILTNSIYMTIYGLTCCMCGYHEFKFFPFYVFSVLELLLYFSRIKKYIKENNNKILKNNILLIMWIVITLLIYILLIIAFPNDMEALHTL